MTESAYNPLDKLNLARSVEDELLKRKPVPIASISNIVGAGVYVIYYTGPFPAYAPITRSNRGGEFTRPIYVGKAIPKGGRKGGLSTDASVNSRALAARLRHHAASIKEAKNLELADFHVRHLVVDDIWIPLGENMLIETFEPVWNRAIDGFGNNDPGGRRATQYKSPWDVLHPGRRFADKLANGGMTPELLIERIKNYFAEKPLGDLPKVIVKEQIDKKAKAEELANED